jgi:hypothetical protein
MSGEKFKKRRSGGVIQSFTVVDNHPVESKTGEERRERRGLDLDKIGVGNHI